MNTNKHEWRMMLAGLLLAACMGFAHADQVKEPNPVEDFLWNLTGTEKPDQPEQPETAFKWKVEDMSDYSGSGLKRRMWRMLVLGKGTVPDEKEMKAVAAWWYDNAAPSHYDEISIIFHLEGLPFEQAIYALYQFNKGKGLTQSALKEGTLWLRENWETLE